MKTLEKEVICNTTLENLDEYLYQINLLHDELVQARSEYWEQKKQHEVDYESRVKELLDQEDENWKKPSKTSCETAVKVEMSGTIIRLDQMKTDLENLESHYKLGFTNYHHWKSKLKWDFDIDKQVNWFESIKTNDELF